MDLTALHARSATSVVIGMYDLYEVEMKKTLTGASRRFEKSGCR